MTDTPTTTTDEKATDAPATTSTAMEKAQADPNPANLPDRYRGSDSAELAVAAHSNLPEPRELNALWKIAGAYAAMPGMSETYANNQPAVMAALLTAWTLDLPTTPQVVNEFYAWKAEGNRMTMYPSTTILVALAAKNGVEVWFDEASDATFAKAFCRRRGEQRVHSYTYTYEMAKAAGLVNKPNWKAAPDVMCRYRAARRLLKSVAPDVVLGIPSNVLDAEPIPVLDRKELEAAATELHVRDDDDEPGPTLTEVVAKGRSGSRGGSVPQPDTTPCRVSGCTQTGKHTHDPYVEREYADDDPERPFD